jgi:hypothetical protein
MPLPGPFAAAGIAAIGEVLDRDALLAGHFAPGERLSDAVNQPEEHAG